MSIELQIYFSVTKSANAPEARSASRLDASMHSNSNPPTTEQITRQLYRRHRFITCDFLFIFSNTRKNPNYHIDSLLKNVPGPSTGYLQIGTFTPTIPVPVSQIVVIPPFSPH